VIQFYCACSFCTRTALIQLPYVLPGSHALEPGYSCTIICYKCSLVILLFQTNKPDDDDEVGKHYRCIGNKFKLFSLLFYSFVDLLLYASKFAL